MWYIEEFWNIRKEEKSREKFLKIDKYISLIFMIHRTTYINIQITMMF